MADDVSIADDVQFCTFESTATRHEQIGTGCAPPEPALQRGLPRKNEDPQFELRFPWRDLIDSGEFLQSMKHRLPPLCSTHIPLEQMLTVESYYYNIVRLRIG